VFQNVGVLPHHYMASQTGRPRLEQEGKLVGSLFNSLALPAQVIYPITYKNDNVRLIGKDQKGNDQHHFNTHRKGVKEN